LRTIRNGRYTAAVPGTISVKRRFLNKRIIVQLRSQRAPHPRSPRTGRGHGHWRSLAGISGAGCGLAFPENRVAPLSIREAIQFIFAETYRLLPDIVGTDFSNLPLPEKIQ